MQNTEIQSNKKIRVLLLRFKNNIHKNEVSLLRGAVIHAINKNDDILFHNHEGNKFRYSYPLIQYKRINQKGAIICVNEGTDVIGNFFSQCNFDFSLGEKQMTMEIESIKANQYLVQIWDFSFYYRIRKWLPLNQENYQEFLKLEGLSEKSLFLEKILIGNILSFAKGVNIHLESQVSCKITNLSEPIIIRYKEVKMMSFDTDFMSNVSLPDYIGLGKSVSLGFGTVTQNYDKKESIQ